MPPTVHACRRQAHSIRNRAAAPAPHAPSTSYAPSTLLYMPPHSDENRVLPRFAHQQPAPRGTPMPVASPHHPRTSRRAPPRRKPLPRPFREPQRAPIEDRKTNDWKKHDETHMRLLLRASQTALEARLDKRGSDKEADGMRARARRGHEADADADEHGKDGKIGEIGRGRRDGVNGWSKGRVGA
ncbi:hypothetical protein B0H17DRAFT_1203118 [Mycena rosella]|uniref:Uncharacterized protein n=1 Tax=Mycena rosella TaxID=1033263 RepID=A0AAD7DBZ5_MYCRO|nr:hypothetical protein B0H17DRAFT_1203118 [Mycena rosella]